MQETVSKPTRRFECHIKQKLENKVTRHALYSFGLGQGQVAGCCSSLWQQNTNYLKI
jgi:hypothetical protein